MQIWDAMRLFDTNLTNAVEPHEIPAGLAESLGQIGVTHATPFADADRLIGDALGERSELPDDLLKRFNDAGWALKNELECEKRGQTKRRFNGVPVDTPPLFLIATPLIMLVGGINNAFVAKFKGPLKETDKIATLKKEYHEALGELLAAAQEAAKRRRQAVSTAHMPLPGDSATRINDSEDFDLLGKVLEPSDSE